PVPQHQSRLLRFYDVLRRRCVTVNLRTRLRDRFHDRRVTGAVLRQGLNERERPHDPLHRRQRRARPPHRPPHRQRPKKPPHRRPSRSAALLGIARHFRFHNSQNRRDAPANTATSAAALDNPRFTPPSNCTCAPTRRVSPQLKVATCEPSPTDDVSSKNPP